jgi:hypothetical protein
MRGPQFSAWIIDEGDFLSTSVAQASTRGKVFRLDTRSLVLTSTLE